MAAPILNPWSRDCWCCLYFHIPLTVSVNDSLSSNSLQWEFCQRAALIVTESTLLVCNLGRTCLGIFLGGSLKTVIDRFGEDEYPRFFTPCLG